MGSNSPADPEGSGHLGACLRSKLTHRMKPDKLLLRLCFEMSLTPSGLSYNVCEPWDLSSQVIYLKGTFVTCTRNGYLPLKIYLPLLLFITES